MVPSYVSVIALLQLLCAVIHLVQHQLMKINSDPETMDAMESSLPDPDVTLDDDLSATDDPELCSASGDDSKITL